MKFARARADTRLGDMRTKTDETCALAGVDRRAAARVTLRTPLVARRPGDPTSFAIEEASMGGFSIKSPVSLQPDTIHHFRIANAKGQVAMVQVACRNCVQLQTDGAPLYRIGFEFLPQSTRRLRIVLGALASDAP